MENLFDITAMEEDEILVDNQGHEFTVIGYSEYDNGVELQCPSLALTIWTQEEVNDRVKSSYKKN